MKLLLIWNSVFASNNDFVACIKSVSRKGTQIPIEYKLRNIDIDLLRGLMGLLITQCTYISPPPIGEISFTVLIYYV